MYATNAAVRLLPRTLTVLPGGLSSTPFAAPVVRPIGHAPPMELPEPKAFAFAVNGLVFSWIASAVVGYASLFVVGLHSVLALH